MTNPGSDLTKLPGYLPPAQRPKCRLCGKRLRPCVFYKYVNVETPNGFHTASEPERVRSYGCEGSNLFCSKKCGFAYGVRAAKRSS